jgi:hypothetical protein
VWAAKLNCRWCFIQPSEIHSNLGGTGVHRQLKHSLSSFVLMLFILGQPNMCWLLAVQANNVTVGIGHGIMAAGFRRAQEDDALAIVLGISESPDTL